MLQKYDLSPQTIGQTVSSSTYFARDKKTQESVAIKKFEFVSEHIQRLIAEFSILKRLNHENLLRIINFYEDAEHSYLVQEIAPEGELLEYVCNKRYYSEDDCRNYVRQMLHGLAYLHQFNIGHLNLKPENILIKEFQGQLVIKLADFDQYLYVPTFLQLFAPGFAAPEQLLNEPFTVEPDIYSIGVITHLLLTGQLPYAYGEQTPDDDLQFVTQLVDATTKGNLNILKTMSPEARLFINNCLEFDASSRATIYDLLESPWMKLDAAPVIPLSGAQSQLRRFMAKMRLRGGSGVSGWKLQKMVQKIVERDIIDDEVPLLDY